MCRDALIASPVFPVPGGAIDVEVECFVGTFGVALRGAASFRAGGVIGPNETLVFVVDLLGVG